MRKIVLHLSDDKYGKWQKKKAKDGFDAKSWDDYGVYLVRDIPHMETTARIIAKNTREGLARMWMQNLAENLPDIRGTSKCMRDIANKDTIPTPAIVIGAGPSIYKHKHLEQLAQSNFNGIVLCTDKMLIPALEAGVKVDYVTSVDGHPDLISPFFDDDIVEEKRKDFKVLMIIQTSHKTYEVCRKRGLDIYWFMSMQDDPKAEDSSTRKILYMTMSEKNPLGVPAVPSGGNVGCTTLAIAIDVLKCLHVGLIGFDYGYPDSVPAKETSYYSGFLRLCEEVYGRNPIASAQAMTGFTYHYHPVFKTKAYSDIVFDNYRASLYEMLETNKRPCNIYNCTMGGTLYHPRMLKCITFKEFLDKFKT